MSKTLKFLGSDAGYGKNNNSAYIEFDNKLLLIDCGFTVFGKIQEQFDLSKYNEINVIITHLHNDHAGSLSQLILYLFFEYGKKVKIISKCEHLNEYLQFCGTPVESFDIVNETENIIMIKTDHTPFLDAYGFNMILNGRNIIYTGDTKIIKPFLPYLDEVEELYIDVSKSGGAHLKIEDILDRLTELKEKGVDIFLMHVDDKEYVKNVVKGEFEIA